MRVTRARAQQPVEEPTVTEQERAPLNEISPNASPEQVLPVEDIVKKTPARSKSKKGAKKGAKGKKNKVVEDEPVQLESGVEQEVAAAVPVIDAQEELAKDEPSGELLLHARNVQPSDWPLDAS